MIEWQFYINDLEIEEPIGFAELELSIIRDDKTHGIGFESSTGSLRFYGAAYTFLKNEKETNGLKSNVSFLANSRCDEDADYEEIVRGNLNFGKYKEICGSECFISMPIEQEGCVFTFKNRYDQKVDIDSNKGFDGITVLPGYAGLNNVMDLPAKELLASVSGSTDGQPEVVELEIGGEISTFEFRPTYSTERYNSITTGQLTPANNYAYYPDDGLGIPFIVSPVLLLDEIVDCFDGDFVYTIRVKGSLTVKETLRSNDLEQAGIRVVKFTGDYHDVLATILHETNLNSIEGHLDVDETVSVSFDETYTGSTPLEQGESLFIYLYTVHNPDLAFPYKPRFTITFDPLTSVDIVANKSCPTTTAELSLVHETLSRVTEAITDYCVRVKSSYYGRLDSEPFAFTEDGCGGLRTLTSGLKIRKAIEDKFFVSMKDLMEGLTAIDNIGMDIIDDPDRADKYLLRIEDLDFWYEDRELLRFDAIPDASLDMEENKFYSKILVGYKKWEVEKINGLDEFNSNREYRTSLTSVSNTLDITSNLVAGSYPIEVTRQQSFAATGAADTKYDNEVFIIAVKRNVYPAFVVEQGNIANAENIFSPDTVYNFRLSPIRNLMRWYRSIVNSYPNLSDKIFFSSGTGNLIAKGEIETSAYITDCKLENMPMQENQHLFTTQFAANTYTPLWKNETVPFEYPLSIKEYKQLKAAPYGYISYQCGLGEFDKGYIKEIKYKPVKGTATFILKRKWQS